MASSPTSPGSTSDDLTGRVLGGRYRIERPIASGGMAQVWEATDETLARRVAVKVLHPHLAKDDTFVQRFRGEAIAAARLAHPSIVSVYDTIVEDGINAIIMELVQGTTMRADLDEHGPLQLKAVLAIGSQVADALGAAHASGLVHRDVKPANILLSRDGRVLVADFGIAKAAQGSDLTSDGAMVGTVKYLAPEQVEGHAVDARTDLYALGIVLYEALTGKAPFVAETDAGTALARLHRDPASLRSLRPEVPRAVEAVISQAMARRPDDRFANSAAMRRALVQAGAEPAEAPAVVQAAVAATSERLVPVHDAPSGPSAPARPAPPRPQPPRPVPTAPAPRRAPTARWVVALVVLVAIGVVGWVVFDRTVGQKPVGAALPIAVSTFDPLGPGDGERDEDLGLINDDDPDTAWQTEGYSGPSMPLAGGAKDGVGLVLALDASQEVGRLDLTTPHGGWTAEIYLIDGERPVELEGWGAPVGTAMGIDPNGGTAKVDLGDQRATDVLVWFTELTQDPDGDWRAQISTIALRSP